MQFVILLALYPVILRFHIVIYVVQTISSWQKSCSALVDTLLSQRDSVS